MTDHLRTLSGLAKTLVSCYPNAGLPDSDGQYEETPEIDRRAHDPRFSRRAGSTSWADAAARPRRTSPRSHAPPRGSGPRRAPIHNRAFLSGSKSLEITKTTGPCSWASGPTSSAAASSSGSSPRASSTTAAEIARAQVRKRGARSSTFVSRIRTGTRRPTSTAFLERATKMVKVPLMIDSTDAGVMELGLKWSQGKSILNSINLEDGEARFQSVVPLAQKYGAALVVGTIDEDPVHGMAVTRDRKLEIARRSFTLLTEKYGVAAEDILFDPLVFPCGTGDEKYVGSAIETIEGIRLIKAAFPQTKTILGISNVSFGSAGVGPGGLELRLPLPLRQGGSRPRDREHREDRPLPVDPGGGTPALRGPDRNRGSDPVGAFAAYFKAKGRPPREPRVRPGTAVERLAGLHRRRLQGGTRCGPRGGAERAEWPPSTSSTAP